jgi:flagellar biogenesis protein FliO
VLFRRVLRGSLRARAARRSLAVVDVLPLGTRQKLVVVRCYDRSFLLGVGDKEVSVVAELDPENEIAPARAAPVTAAAPRLPFRELLARQRRTGEPVPAELRAAESLVEGGIFG